VFVPYVELHAHSAFSFLDGASLPDELAAAAVELGYEAMALTDHNGVSGSMEFAIAAAPLGLRAIHGVEMDLEDGRHLTLLVEDNQGWRNLCRIVTRAHVHDRDPREPPPAVPLEVIADFSAGLVCLSGCADHGVEDEATLRRLREAFGPERLRVELQRPFQRHDRARNRARAALARRLELRTVATGNVHAHSRSRAPLQDAFVALQHHLSLDSSEPVRRGNTAHVLASPAAMAARFEGHEDAVRETEVLAERLRFDLTADLGYRYPGAEDPQASRKLAELCWLKLGERYQGASRADAEARLNEELRVIDMLGLPGFFLLHRDLLELARDVAVEVRGPSVARQLLPPGRGRGSSVSSIVCYLTGLSHIDPVANDLYLGRFLNEELNSLPDIDLDFPRDVREVLIPRVHERYGKERSALVAAFPTFRSRGAIRELGKVLGLPSGELERVARGAEPWAVKGVERDVEVALGIEPSSEPGPFIDPDARASAFAMSTAEWLAMVHGHRPDKAEAHETSPDSPSYSRLPGRWAWLARLCDEAYGLPRHLSQHSGGMIVSTRPLIDCCPVLPAAMEGRQLCQWDKDSCADAGFLKIDLLGLGMLSAVERCVDEIARVRGESVDLSRIPYDDRETYDAIQLADTMGVFQIESRAQMASLRRTRPASLEDLTIQVAIVRPGPILGGAVNPYISRLQRLRADPSYVVPYEHPVLEEVLKDTLGTIIFQDQVIEVAQAFAGFSPGQAEGLRRAMSRKRSAEAIEAFHERFLEGAAATHGVDRETAERVYGMIVGFSGFGFPKAHGAAFGLLAYQSTWLRVHYGPEFLCALMNEQPMGFYAPDTLAHEAQRRGIELLPPDVNASEAMCTVEWAPGAPVPDGAPWVAASPPGASPLSGATLREASPLSGATLREASPRAGATLPEASPPAGVVRMGLGYILGVKEDEVRALVAAREQGGPFASLADLASRAGAGRPSLDRLAWAGACDSLIGGASEHARRRALWQVGIAAPGEHIPDGTQLSLPLEVPEAPALAPLVPWESMIADYATVGLTLGPHPLKLLRPTLPADIVSIADLDRLPHESSVVLGGLVVARQRPGTVNLIVPPDLYEANRLIVRSEPLLLCRGRLERLPQAGGAINVFVKALQPLVTPEDREARVVELAERRVAAAATGRGEGAQGGRAAAATLGEFREFAPAVQSFGSGRRR
jgi:error-prone DNA polymerase